MIIESNCKINLGLNIERRRKDGFHQISTLFYPVNKLCDVVELQKSDSFSLSTSGIEVDCPPEKNLCVKALRLMQEEFGIGPARIHLHKTIPSGAGLGGGSSNATAVIKLCNDLWSLNLTEDQLRLLSGKIGSDTPFFVTPHQPQMAGGRGDILVPFPIRLDGLWLMIVKADVGVSTAEAYAGVIPTDGDHPIKEIVRLPVSQWRNLLRNDFESSIFKKLPLLRHIKDRLYDQGAIYASMSGSGSSIFGLFEQRPEKLNDLPYFTHMEQISNG